MQPGAAEDLQASDQAGPPPQGRRGVRRHPQGGVQ